VHRIINMLYVSYCVEVWCGPTGDGKAKDVQKAKTRLKLLIYDRLFAGDRVGEHSRSSAQDAIERGGQTVKV